MKLALVALAVAVYASANPIGVTGSGTYLFGPGLGGEVEFSVSFSGSDGVNSVSASCLGSFFGTCGLFGGTGLGALIDGQHFSPDFYSVDLGVSITGYDAQFNPVITQEISDSIQPVSTTCSGAQLSQICEETFNVLATPQTTTPEPATWLLSAAVLAVLLSLRRGAQI